MSFEYDTSFSVTTYEFPNEVMSTNNSSSRGKLPMPSFIEYSMLFSTHMNKILNKMIMLAINSPTS